MKIHIRSGTPSRKKYEFGDRREIGGVTHVRCRVFNQVYQSYVVNSNGSPTVDWVPEKDVDFSGLHPVRRDHPVRWNQPCP